MTRTLENDSARNCGGAVREIRDESVRMSQDVSHIVKMSQDVCTESRSASRINYESTELNEEWGAYLSEEELNSETVPERKFALSDNEELWYILEDSFGIIQKNSFKEEIIVRRRYRQEDDVKVNMLNSETVLQRINHVDFDRDVGSKVKTVGRQAELSPVKNKVKAPKTKPKLKKEDNTNILPGNSLRKWLLGGTKRQEIEPEIRLEEQEAQSPKKYQPELPSSAVENNEYPARKCEGGVKPGNKKGVLGGTVPPQRRRKSLPKLQEKLSARKISSSVLRKPPLRLEDIDILSGNKKWQELLRSTVPVNKKSNNILMQRVSNTSTGRSCEEDSSPGKFSTGKQDMRYVRDGWQSMEEVLGGAVPDRNVQNVLLPAECKNVTDSLSMKRKPNLKLRMKSQGSPVRKAMTGNDARKCLAAHRKYIKSAKIKNIQVQEKIELFDKFRGDLSWGAKRTRALDI